MKEFTLKRRDKIKTLKVNIGDESYNIPLAGSIKTAEIKPLETAEGTMAFVKKYIPAEIIDELTQDEYNSLVNAWGEASKAEAGLPVGE